MRKIFHRNDVDYNVIQKRMIWNDRKFARSPEIILQAHTQEDVIRTVHFAHQGGSGNSFSGIFLQSDGILLDLSHLQDIEINVHTKEAKFEPGVTSAMLSKRLAQVGLAFPTGHSSNVSISGFLLGSGAGINLGTWGHGKSVFNIKADDVITADGRNLHANTLEHSDLHWAARGGGPGLFFIVTKFYLQCYSIPNAITSNTYVLPFS